MAPTAQKVASSTTSALLRPELLAPAGDRDCIRAAIENGADAVYFGLDRGFNARARAKNFATEELPEIMRQLHSRGVKGYVTLNTLIFPSELAEVERHVIELAEAGVDAVLVQDLGLARLVKAICPDLAVHASTQMTLSSSECIDVAQELGIERVVLPRELALDEIRLIRAATTMQLEVFVHGALCVAYSGQCLTSESLGGRSANRGQCAQACRLPYDLLCDGKLVETGDQKYLLSPQDLAAYELIPELAELGVCSLKIEGRLKTPEYVANITRHYRQAIDEALAGRAVKFPPEEVEAMELSFSRGFSPGWLKGCDHKMLVPAISSDKRGVLLGTVEYVRNGRVAVQLAASIKRGDGIVFDCGRAEDDQQGGRVYEVYQRGRSLTEPVNIGVAELTFAHGAINFEEIQPGGEVWKTDDPELTNRLRKTFAAGVINRRVPVDFAVTAHEGQPLLIRATAEGRAPIEVASSQPLEAARQHVLDEAMLRTQLGRLGSTPFEIRNLQAEITGRPMVPLSVLGKLRHEVVKKLTATMEQVPERRIIRASALSELRATLPVDATPAENDAAPQLHVLCRSLAQLNAVLKCAANSVYVDFADIREYRAAVELAHEASAKIWLATPRIQKPGEAGIFRALSKHGADGVLARNLAGLRYFVQQGLPVVADFSLNCSNELTAQWLDQQGATRISPSYDLNREQLLELVAAVPTKWLECVIHQHMPMFHMEHCVFCAMLSPGTNKNNCGRPCDNHQVALRDRMGIDHPLTADVGCRNTLFNAVPQSAAEVVPALLAQGVRHFRVELLEMASRQEEQQILQTLELYRRLLRGEVTGREVWSKLSAANRVGVTRGTLEERRHPLAII
ncbi:putative protease YhbU precursor [Anatilimnocola aggregata]|uniref:Putative protease YhbU n=1 Tax=Anatilimnocola aggregata TaxID=2528021 RepID=A0A517YIP9_9BACT|nr:U32 family peptidase [Anatilimnocola aggregata]QDU30098.1 putative protease YhbU precursor [Anatilimnocola aggregata]